MEVLMHKLTITIHEVNLIEIENNSLFKLVFFVIVIKININYPGANPKI